MILRSVGTHDGTFHADEVTACALLVVFNLVDPKQIFRSRDPQVLASCEYVCDVGGIYDPKKKRYDHHQNKYQGELSSAGMVWKDLLHRKVIDQSIYDYVNRSLILGVDAHDTGRWVQQEGVCTFSLVIANFVPPAQEVSEKELRQSFDAALDFVIGHLKRLFNRYECIRRYRKRVELAMAARKPYLVFDETLPWQESFFELGGADHPALFVVMPAQGQWKLRCIPPDLSRRMEMRLPLPEEWAGLRDEELKKISGIRGAIFCHKGRFISVWETKEDALKALKYVLTQSGYQL